MRRIPNGRVRTYGCVCRRHAARKEPRCIQLAYSELIKNFEKIRSYMREFYVYGFKSRDEYNAKSARSYDNERRRIESWLGDYMGFHRGTSNS